MLRDNPYIVGLGTILVAAAVVHLLMRDNRIKNDRIENGTPFVAYGSMKNWYKRSPNIAFRLARKLFGSTENTEQPASDKTTMELRIPLENLDNNPLFQRDPSEFQIFEIDEPARLSIVEFVVRTLGFDAAGLLSRLTRTLRPGDLTELRHRAVQIRSLIIVGPINCRHKWQPRQLMHNPALTNNEFDRLIAMLMRDRAFVMLCIRHAGFIDNLVKAALDIAHTENDSIDPAQIPSQTTVGIFAALHNEFYRELANS